MAAADKAIRAAVGSRNAARDVQTLARARQAVPRRRLDDWLRQLERDAKAAFGGKTSLPAYKLLFPQTAAKTAKLALGKRYVAIKNTIDGLGGADVPKALAAAQKSGQALFAALTKFDAEVAQAKQHLEAADSGLDATRTAWFAAYRSLHAALTQKFPLESDKVTSYFLQPAASARAPKAPVPPEGDDEAK